ncbi:hypothetical protein H5410_022214 [Solanum commersonii]|uniref:Uncharacterized protein n=1 Tax=Solanum commersonii TaxID=4109 RepID=A0A9J5ZET8_SOLCO|nr:hypothetical protein H5410_022214 [Solanum commersonii]
MKVVWDSDLFLMCQRLCLLNYGGNLEPKSFCGLIFYGTSIVKHIDPKWYIGKGVLKTGNLCWKLEILWIKTYDQHYNTYEDVKQLLIQVINQIHRVLVVVGKSEKWDKAWWMLTSNGKFTIKSAWEALRRRSSDQEEMKFIW